MCMGLFGGFEPVSGPFWAYLGDLGIKLSLFVPILGLNRRL